MMGKGWQRDFLCCWVFGVWMFLGFLRGNILVFSSEKEIAVFIYFSLELVQVVHAGSKGRIIATSFLWVLLPVGCFCSADSEHFNTPPNHTPNRSRVWSGPFFVPLVGAWILLTCCPARILSHILWSVFCLFFLVTCSEMPGKLQSFQFSVCRQKGVLFHTEARCGDVPGMLQVFCSTTVFIGGWTF